jgi:hypothetical protein
VARGDVETLRRHVEALAPEFRDFYCGLALRTVPLALASGKLDSALAARIREVLTLRGGAS